MLTKFVIHILNQDVHRNRQFHWERQIKKCLWSHHKYSCYGRVQKQNTTRHSSRPSILNERLRERIQKQEPTYGSRYLFLVLLSDLGQVILDLNLKSNGQSVAKLTKPLKTCLANSVVSCRHGEGASHPRADPAKILCYEWKGGHLFSKLCLHCLWITPSLWEGTGWSHSDLICRNSTEILEGDQASTKSLCQVSLLSLCTQLVDLAHGTFRGLAGTQAVCRQLAGAPWRSVPLFPWNVATPGCPWGFFQTLIDHIHHSPHKDLSPIHLSKS